MAAVLWEGQRQVLCGMEEYAGIYPGQHGDGTFSTHTCGCELEGFTMIFHRNSGHASFSDCFSAVRLCVPGDSISVQAILRAGECGDCLLRSGMRSLCKLQPPMLGDITY
jgi:hypothetical protein